jgi:hypothetical protein
VSEEDSNYLRIERKTDFLNYGRFSLIPQVLAFVD